MAQIPYPKFQAFGSNDTFLAGGKLYTYYAGTDTPKATYSDPDLALAHANTNPVILDARGECLLFGSGRYKLVLKDASDATIWTADDIDLSTSDFAVMPDGEFDGVTDDSTAIQTAIDSGQYVVFPFNRTAVVGTTLDIPSNSRIDFNGTLIREHADLGDAPVMQILGTSGTHKENIQLWNLNLRNGTAGGSYSGNRNGLYIDYADNVKLYNPKLNNISGIAGIGVLRSTDILISEPDITDFAYSGIGIGYETVGLTVFLGKIDNCTSSTAQCYGITTGNFNTGTDVLASFPKDILIWGTEVSNVPLWTAIDSHGAQNFNVMYTKIKNCGIGIGYQALPTYVTDPTSRTINFIGNDIIRGTATGTQPYGIILQGHYVGFNFTRDFKVDNNYVHGYGTTAYGAIQIGDLVTDGEVLSNFVEDAETTGIQVGNAVWNCNIMDNAVKNMTGATNYAYIANGYGTFNIHFDKNRCYYDDPDKVIDIGFRTNTGCGRWVIGDSNDFMAVAKYDNTAFLPILNTTIPAYPSQEYILAGGDLITNAANIPQWKCTSGPGLWGLRTAAIVKADIEAASNELTITDWDPPGTGPLADWRYFCPGMNITVAGAGAGGSDLDTMVIAVGEPGDALFYLLADNAQTTVTDADVTYQEPTIITLPNNTVTADTVTGATYTPDASKQSILYLTLEHACKINNPTNVTIGDLLTIIFTQGSLGSYAVTWDTQFKVTWADTNNGVGKVSAITFRRVGSIWSQVGAQSPYV